MSRSWCCLCGSACENAEEDAEVVDLPLHTRAQARRVQVSPAVVRGLAADVGQDRRLEAQALGGAQLMHGDPRQNRRNGAIADDPKWPSGAVYEPSGRGNAVKVSQRLQHLFLLLLFRVVNYDCYYCYYYYCQYYIINKLSR